jgi:hypothetical protein
MALFCGTAIGCSDRPERVPVAGKVLINGQPLRHGYIRFVPTNARPSGGQIGSEGQFRLTCFDESDGAVLGKHSIEVLSHKIDFQAGKLLWLAPKKYSNATTSGIVVEITEPTDQLVINLESAEPLPIEDPNYVQ